VLSLSLFTGTRPYVERLTGLVLTPLSGLVTRVAAELPVLVVVVIAVALVAVIVRTVELFFASVARGETRLTWIEPEVAAATSTLTRVGLVVFALVFVGPVLTGSPEGALSRTGVVILIALALASTPLLASIIAGVALSFARAVKLGDRVEYGGRLGVVRDIGMIVMTLEDDDGGSVRVPHALSLFLPTRIIK
ncbi:MAG TPA: mechanosensitive ion channel domain-containing protein, partial [Polyangiales bacterium]|nr:mechanosensitive ion channel domain-containing protein [Polyangiales bacterium]